MYMHECMHVFIMYVFWSGGDGGGEGLVVGLGLTHNADCTTSRWLGRTGWRTTRIL